MKKIVAILMVLLAVFMFSSCPGVDDEDTADKKGNGEDPDNSKPVVVTAISLDPTNLSIEIDDYDAIDVTTTPAGGTVTWSSSNNNIATVDSTGKVTGIAVGTATITATAGTVTAFCTVTVTNKAIVVTAITLDPTTLSLELNATGTITATTTPAGGSVTWSSSDSTKASVSNAGVVTGKFWTDTAVTITATSGTGEAAVTATCAVTVNKPTSNFAEVSADGKTLVHTFPKLVGSTAFGADSGTTNEDGSYTFDGTADAWKGGAARYTFPEPITPAQTWKLADYNVVEIFFATAASESGTSVSVGLKTSANQDLPQYPTGGPTSTFSTTDTDKSLKFIMAETGGNVTFQRNTGGPVTVTIQKVVFSKVEPVTVTFSGGEATSVTFPSQTVLPGRTITLPNPRFGFPGHRFLGWFKNVNDETSKFEAGAPLEETLTLTAKWELGDPITVDMTLNLNPVNWPSLPQNNGYESYGVNGYYAGTVYDEEEGTLTITFSGKNRERAIIPLSEDQILELLEPDVSGVTFRFEADIVRGGPWSGTATALTNTQLGGTGLEFAGFRVHLANPSMDSWHGTDTGNEYPFTGNRAVDGASPDHLFEYRPFFTTNTTKPYRSFVVIQAMFRAFNNDGSYANNNTPAGFPQVVITIRSVKVEPNDTRTEEDLAKQLVLNGEASGSY